MLEKFTKNLECPETYSQLDNDLKIWQEKSINFKKVMKSARERWAISPRSYSFCHYMILNQEVSVK